MGRKEADKRNEGRLGRGGEPSGGRVDGRSRNGKRGVGGGD